MRSRATQRVRGRRVGHQRQAQPIVVNVEWPLTPTPALPRVASFSRRAVAHQRNRSLVRRRRGGGRGRWRREAVARGLVDALRLAESAQKGAGRGGGVLAVGVLSCEEEAAAHLHASAQHSALSCGEGRALPTEKRSYIYVS